MDLVDSGLKNKGGQNLKEIRSKGHWAYLMAIKHESNIGLFSLIKNKSNNNKN